MTIELLSQLTALLFTLCIGVWIIYKYAKQNKDFKN